MPVVTLRPTAPGIIAFVLTLAACKTPRSFSPVQGNPPLPNASTLLEYIDDSNRVLYAQVLAFHPEYTAFQLFQPHGNPTTGMVWNTEIMADALSGTNAILTGFEPQDTRLNNHTAFCLSRNTVYQIFKGSPVELSLEKTIKAYEANGDSLLLFQPLVQESFQILRQQDYHITFNGRPRIVPTEVVQARRAYLRLSSPGSVHPLAPNPLLYDWNDFSGNAWSLARYWQYDSLPVLPTLFPGNYLDYHYYRPVESDNGRWEYRSDTFRVQFKRADTVLHARVFRISRDRTSSGEETDFYFNLANAKGRFSENSPFPPLGFCLTDSMLPKLLSDAFASFPSVSTKALLPAALVLNPQGNHIWSHSCAVNGSTTQLNGFRVRSEDQTLDIQFMVFRQTPFILSYSEGMHSMQLINVHAGKSHGRGASSKSVQLPTYPVVAEGL